MNEWISVKDKEAPKDIEFLGYVLVGNFIPGILDERTLDIQTCLWNGYKYMESCHCSGREHDYEDIEICYWMPLPKPPEGI
jgi:hypothetical protein